MSGNRPGSKGAAEALQKALRLAKSQKSDQLAAYLEKVCPRFPESFPLWKLWYFACRGRGDEKNATLIALAFLNSTEGGKDAVRWMDSLLRILSKPDEEILAAADRVSGKLGLKYKALLNIVYRDLPAGLDAFRQLRERWGAGADLSFSDFAKFLSQAGFFEAAEEMYWKALESGPLSHELIESLANNQLEWGMLENPEKLLETQQLAKMFLGKYPDSPEACFVMGMFWRAISRPERGFPYMMKYFESNPDSRWRSAVTFDLAYMEDMPESEAAAIRRSWSEHYAEMFRTHGPPIHNDRDPDRRLRIGYVSPDFGKHPVGYFAKTILFEHDPREVEVFLYSQRDPVGENDEISREFIEWAGESHWRWIRGFDNLRLLHQVREDRIDILVDLAGHSSQNRLDVFCNRGAPVQVTWLGGPSSTGMPNIDYRFSDAIVEPEGDADLYSSEKIWRLPNGFHAIRFPEDLPAPAPPPMLENGFITFGSFNNAKKLGAETIALWAKIMREIPGAQMLLKHFTMQNFANREIFRSLFVLEGVDSSRIRFQGTTPRREDHFAHYAKIDVALDPVAYNGTTTTCEALYMGVPVLTRKGSNHASRVSASLLHRLGMDGWVAGDDDHFIRIAQAAAARPEAVAARRAGMRAAYLSSPLADGRGLARDMEVAYREMWRRKCAEDRKDLLKTN